MRLRNVPGSREHIAKSRFCVEDPAGLKGKWDKEFGNKKDIHVEIGMGKGRFIMELASRNPEINYIGIEMYSSVLVRAIEKAEKAAEEGNVPENFRFIRMDARELENVFAPGEVKKIYLNFSDPWPKEKHAKRRLTSVQFLDRYEMVLDTSAGIEFKTDNKELFEFSLEQIKEKDWILKKVSFDLYSNSEMMDGNVQTEYEAKFSAEGKKICKLCAEPLTVAVKDNRKSMVAVNSKKVDINENLKEKFCDAIGTDRVLLNEPMSRHTSFRIGGPAAYFLVPADEKGIVDSIEICRKENVPYFIIGNGTNLLVSDDGFNGAVIQVCKNFREIKYEDETVTAQAGALMSQVASGAEGKSLTGLEFASGIPGTLGGAVMMNAGAYGGEMKDIVVSATVYKPGIGIVDVAADEMEFGYRTSVLKDKDWVVLGAVLKLEKGERDKIRSRMLELKEARTSKQPLEFPSAGSTFKRPEGFFAGKLIMDAGLKGARVGGACVSEKHCGFIINDGGATSSDVCSLIEYVTKTVKEKYGVTLEPEVKFL